MLWAVKMSRAPVAHGLRQARERIAHVIGVRIDEPGMQVPVADV